MDKESFKKLLSKYNFNYDDFNNIVSIQLEHSLEVNVDFNLFEKILISDRLKAWNFLTGILPMKLRNAVLYNFIGLLLVGLLFLLLATKTNAFTLLLIYLMALGWIILWTLYYLHRSENLKRLFMAWLEK